MQPPGVVGAEIARLPPVHKPHWEYGFDLDAVRVQSQFTAYLAAQWNYMLKPFDTMLGVAMSATPQTVKKAYVGGKSETALYTWGLDARQDFLNEGAFSLGASLVLGSGVAYVREHDVAKPTVIHGISIRHVEPGVYGTFVSYKSVEVGATAGLSLVMVDDNIKEIKSADLTSVVFGFTFRERRTM